MHARFVAQGAVRAGAPRGEDGLLETPEASLGQGKDLHLPATPLAEPGVHAEQAGGEQGRFVAPRAGADLHDGVTVSQRIRRGEELGETPLQLTDLRAQALDID